MLLGARQFFAARKAAPQTTQFRYIRLELTKLRVANTILQMSLLDIIDPASWTIFQWPVGTTAFDTPYGRNEGTYSSTERPDKLLDGRTTTKMCRQGVPAVADISCYVYIDLGEGNAIDISVYRTWRWWTANGNSIRDPVSFNLAFSNDNATWQVMDTQTDYPVTVDRQAVGYYGDILPTAWTNPYVADALVGMWDAEWNAGGGIHAATNTWKDLVGDRDLTVDQTYGAFKTNRGNCLHISDCGTTGYAATGGVAPAFTTMEAVVKFSDNYGQNSTGALICTGYEGRGMGQFSAGWIVMSTSSSNGSGVLGTGEFPTKFRYVTFVYTSGTTGRMFLDGAEVSIAGQAPAGTSATNYLSMRIGNGKTMDIYALRLHSRALTDAEIAANYAIDKARFNLP